MTTKTAQFTPLKKAVRAIPMLYAEAFAGSNNKEFVVELYEDARLLETAAPAMYEALAKLRLEAIHYRNTGVGVQFLNAAIDRAEVAINQAVGVTNDTARTS